MMVSFSKLPGFCSVPAVVYEKKWKTKHDQETPPHLPFLQCLQSDINALLVGIQYGNAYKWTVRVAIQQPP